MNYSTNYNIPLFEGTDVSYLPTYNTAFELIDSTLKTAYDTAQSAASSSGTATASIGDLTSLTTDVKTTVVGAINEVDANTDTNTSHIGTMTDLTTTVTSSLVGAINEVDAHTDTNTSNIGDLTDLSTTAKSTLVAAINEVATGAGSKVGDLSELTTTDKTDAVSAINEVNSGVAANASDIGTLADLETTVKTDLVSAINEVVAGDTYSSSEQEVGVWIDGTTPVYERTFISDTAFTSGSTTIETIPGIRPISIVGGYRSDSETNSLLPFFNVSGADRVRVAYANDSFILQSNGHSGGGYVFTTRYIKVS